MPRLAPAYIPVDVISAAPITHAWDDFDPYRLLGEPAPTLVARLEEVSLKAVYAYALGCGEWVLYRLDNAFDDARPWQYFDAQWARLLDWGLGYDWTPDREQMAGAVRGPIGVTIRQITKCHDALGAGEGQVDAALIARVVEHVLPDAQGFRAWQKTAIDRLQRLYTPEEIDPFGPAVPREALDASVKLTAESGVKLVQAYVKTLDFSKNEYLNPDAVAGR